MSELTLIGTAAMGVEAVVGWELEALGYEPTLSGGQARFAARPADIPRVNLWLRSADRVKLLVGEFDARSFEALYEGTRALPWTELLPHDATFPVSGRSVKSKLFSVPDCQRIVKRAIADAMRERFPDTRWFPEDGPEFPIEVALRDDVACLTIDTSGTALHRRGYRQHAGPSPLKETLAAALVQLTYWNADRPFADPFCGSGTLAIEAAMIGRDMAPGVGRSFASQEWAWIGVDAWDDAYEEAEERARPDRPLDILGSDVDPSMVSAAIENAEHAGLDPETGGKRGRKDEGLRFKQMHALDLAPWTDFGVIVTNPPYGERIGEREEVARLYRQLGERWRDWPTWSAFVLTSHPQFEELFGAQADRRRKLYNGPIEAQYYQYHSEVRPRDRDAPVTQSAG